jgi:NDP-sugar pyrophosphorylase family protein
MKPTLLILAAGMGSRYGGLKQLDQMGPHGETILEYSVYDAIQAGFGKVVFVIRQDIDAAFRTALGDKFARHIEVDYVHQELDKLPTGHTVPEGRSKPWGTGHAVLMAAETIKEPFLMINADDFYGREAYEAAASFLSEANVTAGTWCLVGYQVKHTLSDFGTVSRGTCQADANGMLTHIVERTKIGKENSQIMDFASDPKEPIDPDAPVSMNMMGFTPTVFDTCGEYFREFLDARGNEPKSEFYIPEVMGRAINENRASVKLLTSEARWFGVTYQEDKPIVQRNLARLTEAGTYPSPLWR